MVIRLTCVLDFHRITPDSIVTIDLPCLSRKSIVAIGSYVGLDCDEMLIDAIREIQL